MTLSILALALLQLLTLEGGAQVAHCRPDCDMRAAQLAEAFIDAAAATDIPAKLVAAVAFVESGLNPHPKPSPTGVGLMQLNPRNSENRAAIARGQRSAITRAAVILRREYERCGGDDWAPALQAYNSGRCHGNPRYPANVFRIMDRL